MPVRLLGLIGVLLGGLILAAVYRTPSNQMQSSEPPSQSGSTAEIVFYDWPEDEEAYAHAIQTFTAESGIKVRFEAFASTEEAINNIRAGKVYDVVVLENLFLSDMIAQGLLAPINRQNIPNFKNISPSFRDLVYDPGNKYTIPYSWSLTGLVVRSDLVGRPVTRWADMWDPRYAGKVVNWLSTPRFTLGAVLHMLGYSANSENAVELEEALQKLIDLKKHAIWLDTEVSSAPMLVNGDAVMALGWVYDLQTAREANVAVDYILPEEGGLLSGDSFVIPANSPNKAAAEALLNFILRPQIAAEIMNKNYYAMANDAALQYVDAPIRNDPIVFPPSEQLRKAELLLPLSPKGEQLYANIWQQFLDAEK